MKDLILPNVIHDDGCIVFQLKEKYKISEPLIEIEPRIIKGLLIHDMPEYFEYERFDSLNQACKKIKKSIRVFYGPSNQALIKCIHCGGLAVFNPEYPECFVDNPKLCTTKTLI